MVLIDILVMMARRQRLSRNLMVMNEAEAGKQTMRSHRSPYEEQENDYHGFKPSHEEEINLNTLPFNLYLADVLEVYLLEVDESSASLIL